MCEHMFYALSIPSRCLCFRFVMAKTFHLNALTQLLGYAMLSVPEPVDRHVLSALLSVLKYATIAWGKTVAVSRVVSRVSRRYTGCIVFEMPLRRTVAAASSATVATVNWAVSLFIRYYTWSPCAQQITHTRALSHGHKSAETDTKQFRCERSEIITDAGSRYVCHICVYIFMCVCLTCVRKLCARLDNRSLVFLRARGECVRYARCLRKRWQQPP